jgi:protein-L-isoaspartate(D-aspartate) O-methyltransferase
MDALGYDNVSLRVGDGTRGWAEAAPFDKILVTAAAAEPPPRLLQQLRAGGRMVIPLGGEDAQQISVVEKHGDDDVTTRAVLPAKFAQLETA